MRRYVPSVKLLVRLSVGVLVLSFLSCSPGYVLRASWEEAGILMRRERIDELLLDDSIDAETKRKFRLVLDARTFAEHLGLKPKGSFSKFSAIDRDVLVWVLSGAEKTSLVPVTWWFPVVGSVPYKGYFEKEDGLADAEKLRKKGFDIFLRPSPAFSTLGWFDDPLLSTTLKSEDIDLVNTVIHEILHNTIWVSGQVPFNESLANFIGSRGVAEYFRERMGPDSPLTIESEASWHDQLIYAHFLEGITNQLKVIYDDGRRRLDEAPRKDQESIKAEIMKGREKIFLDSKAEWAAIVPTLKTKRFLAAAEKLNNAVILAQQAYFQTPWIFEELYQACGGSLPVTLETLKKLQDTPHFKDEPFRIVQEKVKVLQSERLNSLDSRV